MNAKTEQAYINDLDDIPKKSMSTLPMKVLNFG